MPNQKIIGRYQVTSVMGQGAMGTVYKALDPVIERVVAIKTINLELSREERAEFEERFYREAKSAGRLSHPNIVTIYDVGETDEAAYIAMEYLEGESLRDVLDSGVVLPLAHICSIAAKVANALDYAHENGVVHRDIKPANIMISRSRDVKIMDFGIALIPTGSRTQAGTVLGSPKYMAPEQLTGKATDGRVDIFSLGVVLYEMLTGVAPFNGDNLSAIMYRILNETPAPPSALNARVPPELDRIVARALAKRPEDRYRTAGEFARALEHWEAPFSGEAAQADGKAAKPAQKGAASPAPRNSADGRHPLDVETEILPSRAARGNAGGMKPAQPPTNTRRAVFLLAIPALALAAFAVLQLTPQPQAPDIAAAPVQQPITKPAAGKTPADKPADGQSPPPPAQDSLADAAAPRPAAASAEPKPAAAAATATLSFAITPWGEVFVDGRKAGVSPPLSRLEIQAGTHSIEIRNASFAPRHVKVNVEAGQTLKIKHKFK